MAEGIWCQYTTREQLEEYWSKLMRRADYYNQETIKYLVRTMSLSEKQRITKSGIIYGNSSNFPEQAPLTRNPDIKGVWLTPSPERLPSKSPYGCHRIRFAVRDVFKYMGTPTYDTSDGVRGRDNIVENESSSGHCDHEEVIIGDDCCNENEVAVDKDSNEMLPDHIDNYKSEIQSSDQHYFNTTEDEQNQHITNSEPNDVDMVHSLDMPFLKGKSADHSQNKLHMEVNFNFKNLGNVKGTSDLQNEQLQKTPGNFETLGNEPNNTETNDQKSHDSRNEQHMEKEQGGNLSNKNYDDKNYEERPLLFFEHAHYFGKKQYVRLVLVRANDKFVPWIRLNMKEIPLHKNPYLEVKKRKVYSYITDDFGKKNVFIDLFVIGNIDIDNLQSTYEWDKIGKSNRAGSTPKRGVI